MENLQHSIARIFNFSGPIAIERFDGGFLSTNYFVTVGGTKYFLKGYRFEAADRVASIHQVKFFFAAKGIPIMLPVKTAEGGTFFTVDAKHYALFPFVDAVHYERLKIPPAIIDKFGVLLGQIHKAGSDCSLDTVKKFSNKGEAKFKERAEHIVSIIKAKQAAGMTDDFDKRALECLELKLRLSTRDSVDIATLTTDTFGLIHGDFHENNVFFDREGKVKCVFDMEKAVIGPRAFEIWRSAEFMFLNGVFADDRIANVRRYIAAYRSVNPISDDELRRGLELYYQHLIHSLWVEDEHYIQNSIKTDHFLDTKVVAYFGEHRKEFLDKVLAQTAFHT